MNRWPALVLSVALGLGCGYASLGVLSVIGSIRLGFRLWWLEWLIAAVTAGLTFWLAERSVTWQQRHPVCQRGERAIWRLAYRKGMTLSLEQILSETMLDEAAALSALAELERRGEAMPLEGTRWKLTTGLS